jgi:hypothetical protein
MERDRSVVIFIGIIGIFILVIIIGVIIQFSNTPQIKGTDPKILLNYTNTLSEDTRTNPNFDYYFEYYTNNTTNYSLMLNSTIKPITLFVPYRNQTLEECQGYETNVNFSNYKTSNFSFNYEDKTFYYNLTLFNDLYNFTTNLKYQDCYSNDNFYLRYFNDSYNNNLVKVISNDFENLKKQGYTDDEIVEISTIFVQSITYGDNATTLTFNTYPYQTLWDEQGNCLDKSVILAEMIENYGYKTYLIGGNVNGTLHAMVGIGCPNGNIEYGNQQICLIETTNFYPIGSHSDIENISITPLNETGKDYIGEVYGAEIAAATDNDSNSYLFDLNQIDNYTNQLNALYNEMCNTGCINYGCKTNFPYGSGCNAVEYNQIVYQYNPMVDNYNALINKTYQTSYDYDTKTFFNGLNLSKEGFF